MKTWLATLLLAAALTAGTAQGTELQPFTARFTLAYSSLPVGDLRLTLTRDTRPGHWVIQSRGGASGLWRLFYSATAVQTSWLAVKDGQVRPDRFVVDDGTKDKDKDISLHFDWSEGRVAGTSEGKPLDLPTVPNLQDPVSIQIATMVALLGGHQPGTLPMVNGDSIDKFEYTLLRKERIKTDAGEFDTEVYSSIAPDSKNVMYLWLAPKLNYLAVRVEKWRKGKKKFSLSLDKYTESP